MVKNILKELKAFWLERRREVNDRWKRSLPFGDYVVDRWEKAKELGFGEGSSCYDSVVILGDVKVGEKTWIGPFVVLDGSGGLTIHAGIDKIPLALRLKNSSPIYQKIPRLFAVGSENWIYQHSQQNFLQLLPEH